MSKAIVAQYDAAQKLASESSSAATAATKAAGTGDDGALHALAERAHNLAGSVHKFAHDAALKGGSDEEAVQLHTDKIAEHISKANVHREKIEKLQETGGAYYTGKASMKKTTDKISAHGADTQTLGDLHQSVSKAAQEDSRFTEAMDPGVGGVTPTAYCADILHDADEETWSAVICCGDTCWQVPFTINSEDGSISLGTETKEVKRKATYVGANRFCFNGDLVKSAGNSAGASKGNASKKSSTADQMSAAAHKASADAHESGEDEDHGEAAEAHQKASDAHKAAMLAHATTANGDKASYHAEAMVAHDACSEAHGTKDEATVEASLKKLGTVVKCAAVAPKPATALPKPTNDVVHCRANGSKLQADQKTPWVQDQSVKFCYLPGGLHTINAGFSGPITKFRDAGIELTVEVDPARDAAVCQASYDAIKSETPRQDIYGCFEHDEKQASVWAQKFEAGEDPVYGEPAILLEGKPSGGGADAVNRRDWRSWSPSFQTNAEYAKCKCNLCEQSIKACACEKPLFYFPDGVRGSKSKPANITGIDPICGTLTNKPAFRAMPPVRATAHNKVSAEDDAPCEMPEPPAKAAVDRESASSQDATRKAALKSKIAQATEEAYPDGESHGSKENAHYNAKYAHEEAASKASAGSVKDYHNASAEYHGDKAAEHGKVTAARTGFPNVSDILSGITHRNTVDEILATTAPHEGRKTLVDDLDTAEAVLKAVSGIK